MHTITATYEVTTPLFCGGADPTERAELRLPSFKGVLRFWWRALAWSRLGGDLARIRREEDALFGSAAGGQARVVMRLAEVSGASTVGRGQILRYGSGNAGPGVVGEGVRYLGYGLMEAFASKKKHTQAGQLTRPCLAGSADAPLRFAVEILYREGGPRTVSEAEVGGLLNALRLTGLLGGMGARSRRGFGSLVLTGLVADGQERWTAPATAQELASRIRELLPGSAPDGLPPYTALSPGTRCVLLTADAATPLEMLDLVGRELLRYRGWGFKGKVLGESSEQKFKDDHDLMKGLKVEIDHPKRIAFGLPHNYGKHRDQKVHPADRDLDRRASPLFVHIHRCGTRPVAVVAFLPAVFLPEGKREISVGGRKVPLAPENELYQVVHAFLDRLKKPKQRKEPFTVALEVTP